MSKENRELLVNSVIVLLIAALFIIVFIAFVPKSNVDNIFGKVVELEKTELIDGTPEIIKEQHIAKSGKNEYGIVYLVEVKNAFGTLEFYVGIDNDDLVSVEMVEINQSWTNLGLNKFVKDEFKNIPINDVKNLKVYNVMDVDGSAGATASTSPQSVKDGVLEVIDFHVNGPVLLSELELIYGEGAIAAKDEEFVPTDTVLSRSIVTLNEESLGLLYEVKGTGVYQDGVDAKSIIINFALDVEGFYLGEIIPEETYEHTKGFKRQVLNLLGELIDININDLVIEDLDTVAGATNSTSLVIEMLGDLKEAFEPLKVLTNIEQIFGEGAIVTIDEAFVSTDEVLEKSLVTLDSVELGLVYKLKGSGVYVGSNEGSIIIDLILDESDLIKGYVIDQENYEHTPGFQGNVVTFLNTMIDTNITTLVIEDIDAGTGSTNTKTVVIDMLKALKEVF